MAPRSADWITPRSATITVATGSVSSTPAQVPCQRRLPEVRRTALIVRLSREAGYNRLQSLEPRGIVSPGLDSCVASLQSPRRHRPRWRRDFRESGKRSSGQRNTAAPPRRRGNEWPAMGVGRWIGRRFAWSWCAKVVRSARRSPGFLMAGRGDARPFERVGRSQGTTRTVRGFTIGRRSTTFARRPANDSTCRRLRPMG